MNVRKSIVAAVLTLGAPLAALASPVSAGQVEAAERAGRTTAPATAPEAPASDFSRHVHELVVNGASYNDAAVLAARAQRAAAADRAGQPTQEEVQQGTGYAPSSFAAVTPARG